ncbi:MAG: MlaD family protein [Gammaproteobacteria bacterium]
METRASYVLIGAFTLTALAGVLIFVLWLGKLSLDREWDYYDVVFNDPVTGLSLGSAVQFNGIRVGEVRKLSLAPDNPRQAVARVRVAADAPVKTDTVARLAFTGLTGEAIVQLTGGTAAAPRLEAAPGAQVPVLVATPSALQALLTSGEDVVTSVNTLLTRLSAVLNDQNIRALSGTLQNLETVSAVVAGREADIGAAISNIAEVSRRLSTSLQRSEALLGNLDAASADARRLFAEDGPALLASAKASLEALQRTSESVASLVEENRAGLSSFGTGALPQAAPTLTELRATIRPLRRLVERLEQDPGLLLEAPMAPVEYEAPR